MPQCSDVAFVLTSCGLSVVRGSVVPSRGLCRAVDLVGLDPWLLALLVSWQRAVKYQSPKKGLETSGCYTQLRTATAADMIILIIEQSLYCNSLRDSYSRCHDVPKRDNFTHSHVTG